MQLKAAPVENHFHLDGVYMFNVVSRANTTDLDFDEANGIGAFASYRFNSAVAVELGGVAFEPVKSLESRLTSNLYTEYDVTGYLLGIKGTAPVGKLFTAWLSAGLFSWDSTFNYEITYPYFPSARRTGNDSNSGEDYYLRLGVTHPVSESFHLTIETMQMKFSDFFSNTEQGNTDFRQDYIGVGIGMRF